MEADVISSVASLIANIGFPFAMVLILCYFIYKVELRQNDRIDKLSQVVNENTKVIEKLSDRLEMMGYVHSAGHHIDSE